MRHHPHFPAVSSVFREMDVGSRRKWISCGGGAPASPHQIAKMIRSQLLLAFQIQSLLLHIFPEFHKFCLFFLFSFSSISDQLICLVNTRLRLNSADFGHLMLPLFVSVVLFHKNSVPHLSPHPEKTKEPNAITDSPCHKQSRIGGGEAAGTGCPPCDCGHCTHHPAATRPHLAPR